MGNTAPARLPQHNPRERQIYLEEVWRANESGGFSERKKRSKGVLIFESQISHIEMFGNKE